MKASEKCRVDECDRRAAATIVRGSIPGPLPLCAIHTEDFRLHGGRWTVIWDHAMPEPTSVKAAPVVAVGRDSSGSADAALPLGPPTRGAKSRLTRWRRPPT